VVKGGLDYLSFEDWKRLEQAITDKRGSLILKLLYQTGCTVNELVNIRVSDFDFREKRLNISSESSRNRDKRAVYVSSALLDMIKNDIAGRTDGFLLTTRQSGQMTTKRVRQLLKE